MRKVEPEEMQAIAQLAAENPDLRPIPAELARLRAQAALQAAGGLRPASFRELLQAVDKGVMSPREAHSYTGLPERRGTLATLLGGVWAALQVVVATLGQAPRAAGARR